MFCFQKKYFILAVALFIVEVLIAVFVHDRFVRPYVGDFLVVMLIYCFIRSFLNSSAQMLAISVLLFSYLVEALQYFNLVHHLGLGNNRIANIIIGNSFAWADMLAYSLGILAVLLLERKKPKVVWQKAAHHPHFRK